MSCFQQQKTQMNDAKILEKTLKGMGHKPTVSSTETKVKGHGGETRTAQIVVSHTELKTHADIGFKKAKDGSYEVVADTWQLRNDSFSLNDFVKKVNVGYAVNKAKAIAEQYGLEFAGMKTLSNGHTKLEFNVVGNVAQ